MNESYISIAIGVFIVYILINVGIGVWSMMKVKSAAGYYTSETGMGPWAIALAFGATCYSATLIIGYGGTAYNVGASYIWIAATNLFFMTYLVWVVLGKRVRNLVARIGSFTVTEMIVARYQAPRLRPILAIVILFAMMAYTIAVLTATARLFEVLFHIPFFWSLILVSVVVGFYVTTGGIVATVYNNFLQGVVMFVGMLWLGIAVFGTTGFSTGYAELSAQFGEKFVTLPGNITWWGLISVCLITSLLPWGMPQIVHYMFLARKPKDVNRAVPIVTIWSAVILFSLYYVGPVSRVILGEGMNVDKVIPTLIKSVMSPFGIGVVLAAIAAASMSTMAATALQASFAFARDLYQKTFFKDTSDEKILKISKITTLVVIIISIIMAYMEMSNIAAIFNIGAAVSCAVFIPLLVGGVFLRVGTSKGAVATAWVGFLVVLLWALIFGLNGQKAMGIHPIIPGLVCSLITYFAVSKNTEPLDKKFIDQIMG